MSAEAGLDQLFHTKTHLAGEQSPAIFLLITMWFFNKKKTREEIVKDEILRFKKRVEKRFGFTGREGLGPFVKPCVSWYKSEADGIEWNDVHVLLFFSSDKSDMGITIKIES